MTSPQPAGAGANDTAEKVMSILAAVKRIPRETISLDSSLQELGLDSLDTLNVLFELESAFDVSIPDDQARSLRTVGEVVDGIRKLLAGASGPAEDQ